MSVDLSTTYLGLQLKNPLVASAGPLTGNLETLRQLDDSGIAAVVLPSLFEEQIEHDELEINRMYEVQTESYAESLSYFPETRDYGKGSREYLELVDDALLAFEGGRSGRIGVSFRPVATGWELAVEHSGACTLAAYGRGSVDAASIRVLVDRLGGRLQRARLIGGIRSVVTVPCA